MNKKIKQLKKAYHYALTLMSQGKLIRAKRTLAKLTKSLSHKNTPFAKKVKATFSSIDDNLIGKMAKSLFFVVSSYLTFADQIKSQPVSKRWLKDLESDAVWKPQLNQNNDELRGIPAKIVFLFYENLRKMSLPAIFLKLNFYNTIDRKIAYLKKKIHREILGYSVLESNQSLLGDLFSYWKIKFLFKLHIPLAAIRLAVKYKNLDALVSDNCRAAVAEGYFTYMQAAVLPDLSEIVSANGLYALRNNLITLRSLRTVLNSGGAFSISTLVSNFGISILEGKHLTIPQMIHLKNKAVLLAYVPGTIDFFSAKLVDFEFVNTINLRSLDKVFSKVVFELLNLKLILPEDLLQIDKANDAQYLGNESLVYAAKNHLVTRDDVLHSRKIVVSLNEYSIKLLEEKLIHNEDMEEMDDEILKVVCTEDGLAAFRDGCMNADQAKLFNQDNCENGRHKLLALLSIDGRALLAASKIPVLTLTKIPLHSDTDSKPENSRDLPKLMELLNLGLITAGDLENFFIINPQQGSDSNFRLIFVNYVFESIRQKLFSFHDVMSLKCRPFINFDEEFFRLIFKGFKLSDLLAGNNVTWWPALESDIFTRGFLTIAQLAVIKEISEIVKDDVRISILITILEEELLKPDELQHIKDLKTLLCDNGLLLLRKKLISALDLVKFEPSVSREKSILSHLVTDLGVVALEKKYFTPAEAIDMVGFEYILTPNGLKAFDAGLISSQIFMKERYSNLASYRHKYTSYNIKFMLSECGLSDINHGFYTAEDCLFIQCFEQLQITEDGRHVLENRYVNIPNLVTFYKDNFVNMHPQDVSSFLFLVSRDGWELFEKRGVSLDSAMIEFQLLNKDVFTFYEALKGRKISRALESKGENSKNDSSEVANVMASESKSIPAVPTFSSVDNSIAIRISATFVAEGFMTDAELKEILNASYLDARNHLLTDLGLNAFREKLFTVEDILKAIRPSNRIDAVSNLKLLLSKDGISALREGLVTIGHVFSIKNLKPVLSCHGIIALRERLITIAEIVMLQEPKPDDGYHEDNSVCLLTAEGVAALRKKLITPQDAVGVRGFYVFLKPVVLNALYLKIVTVQQLKECGYRFVADHERVIDEFVIDYQLEQELKGDKSIELELYRKATHSKEEKDLNEYTPSTQYLFSRLVTSAGKDLILYECKDEEKHVDILVSGLRSSSVNQFSCVQSEEKKLKSEELTVPPPCWNTLSISSAH